MRNAWNTLLTVLLIVAAYVAYDYFYKTPKEEKVNAYWRTQAFKTDTVTKDRYFTNTLVGDEKVPPATVNYYQTTDEDKQNRILRLLDSTLKVIDTLKKKETLISQNYIKQYPTANKLIAGKFTKDTVSMDLLDIDGNIKTEIYPADFSHFRYFYKDNAMTATEFKTSPISVRSNKPFFRYDGVYLNYEHGLIEKTQTAEALIGFDIWKIRASGFGRYNLKETPGQHRANAGVKIGYKLF